MGLIKKLIIGFFVLLVVGVAFTFGIYHYTLATHEKELIISQSEKVNGPVYYTSAVIPAGKYLIEAESSGVVEGVQILKADTDEVVTEFEGGNVIYSSANPFRVRIQYNAPNPNENYTVSVKIYRLVKK
ncbi:MAG: hypothetical protein H0Z18_03055 [Thermococcus sp.]|uniref:hypothetical protein n=1 Tax=Thermococcus sp. TaxID=35749 RepID=UPI001E0932AE|nr:hypothetical protein [Thermococcus sp.]MBO8174220.1 hypothetical protein [Thermococcus sp.]